MLTPFMRIGHLPVDTVRDRRTKAIFSIAMVGATLFSLQLIAFEARTSLELVFDWLAIIGSLGALAVLQLSKRVDLAYVFVAAILLVVLAAVLLVLGNRNGDLFFLPIIPIFAVVLLGAKQSLPWFAATLLVVVLAAAGDAVLPALTSPLHRSDLNPQGLLFHSPTKEPMSQAMLIGFLTSLTLSYLVIFSAYHSLQQANERVESLLLNVLPSSVALRLTEETRQKLREQGAGIADEYSEATILFADIVGFTDLAAQVTTGELMVILDGVFTAFDNLAEKHQVEKIKTIGDAYMAVCGLPEPNPDHAERIADLALDMLLAMRRYREETGTAIRLRIGINSGPVIAGIIGRKKFIYDLWGDAVNIASRMESHGEPDRIQVSDGTRNALKDAYDLEPLGTIEIKGKGPLPAWRLIGPKGGGDVHST